MGFWRVRGMEKMTTKHWASLAFFVGFGRLILEVAKMLAAAL